MQHLSNSKALYDFTMPELELTRDPFGSNRGKSIGEHVDIVTKKVRTHLVNEHYIPPYRPSNLNWEITFASLGWKRDTIEKFWRLFCKINSSRDGVIKFDEFLIFFDLDWTPWTERCFTYFDTTSSGGIDFLEFMVAVWNVCTFKIDSLSNFTFDMYDLDSDGELSIPEIENMVKELFGHDGGRQCLKQATQFVEEHGGALNLNAFISFTSSHQLLLLPMFQIQRMIQRKVFGFQFWERLERSSKEYSSDQKIFNPRHVQILLRTYKTGGAAAVLRHTGDPNKGLRDWYENQKEHDEKEETSACKKVGGSKWKILKESVKSKTKVSQQFRGLLKLLIGDKLTIFDEKTRRNNIKKAIPATDSKISTEGYDIAKGIKAEEQHLARAIDRDISDGTPSKENLPKTVTLITHSISNDSSASPKTLRPDIAEALQRIRAGNNIAVPIVVERPKLDVAQNVVASSSDPCFDEVPHLYDDEALQYTVTKISETGNEEQSNLPSDNSPSANGAQKLKIKINRRPRKSNQSVSNNIRQRRLGSMFAPTGQSGAWLN